MDQMRIAQMVEVLNGLTASDALCVLVGCMLTVLDEARSDEERQQGYRIGRSFLGHPRFAQAVPELLGKGQIFWVARYG
jgi:hypothetical protein